MNFKKPPLLLPLTLILCVAAAATCVAEDAPAFRAGTQPADVNEPATTMSLPQAIVLGVVEGITEFLPVSSTGHLLLAQGLFGMSKTAEEKDASDAYAICIQLGAILAVFLISFERIRRMALGLLGRDRQGLRLAGFLLLAFVPAALMGLLLEDGLKRYLFDAPHVAVAWIAGGLFILLALRRKGAEGGLGLDDLTWRKALIIGLAQCFALWPGVSRSLATFGAGMLLGLGVSAAVEFSFLLGLLTLGAATVFEGLKRGAQIVETFGVVNPLVGMLAAGVSAFIAIKWMISYLTTKSPAVFGWYRIGIGLVTVALVFRGIV